MVKKPDSTLLFAKYCLHTNKLAPKELSLDELPNLYLRQTKYKSEDEFLTNNLSDILRGLHDRRFGVEEQSGSLARGQKKKKKTQYGGTRSVVDEQIEKNIRHGGISERNILCQAYTCTLDREDNLMTFMLPFFLVNLT